MDWLEEFRGQFPATELCTYMDAAYDCSGALFAKKAAMEYFDVWHRAAAAGERGGPGRASFFVAEAGAKRNIAQLLGGVDPKHIALTKNTNEGFNILLHGFDFHKGDNVVLLDREYSSVVLPCLRAEDLGRVECRFAKLPEDRRISPDLLWDLVDEHTRMILVSHVQSSTGFKTDLAELGRRCREKGIFLVVDAIQSIGLQPLDIPGWNVDAVCAASYKGLCGFISTGFLYCSPELLKHIQPVFVAESNYVTYNRETERPLYISSDADDAARLENPSNDLLGSFILNQTTEQILRIGVDRIHEKISRQFEMLYKGLRELSFDIVTPFEAAHRCASLAVRSDDCVEIVEYFKSKNVIISKSGKGLARFSIGAFTSDGDIQTTLDAARDCPFR